MIKAAVKRRKPVLKLLLFGLGILVCCAIYVFVAMLRVESIQQVSNYRLPRHVNNNVDHKQQLQDNIVHKFQMPASNRSFPMPYKFPLDVPRVAEYCNIPKKVWLGEEGEAPKDFQLISVYTLIRHGDRTPITSYLNIPRPSTVGRCSISHHLLEEHPELRNFIVDMDAQKDRQPPKSEFSRWALYPQMRVCGNSQLTGVGALQHVYNGLALREKYIQKWHIFGEMFSPSTQLYLQSTLLSRTYQSAVAFLYSFLPRFNITELDIRVSKDTVFCNSAFVPHECCESLGKLRQEAERRGPKKNVKNPLRKPAYKRIADVFGVKIGQLPWPSALMDMFQGYICHKITLPCGPMGKCIEADIMEKLWALMDSDGLALVQDPKIEQYSRLVTHSILTEIYSGMARAAKNVTPVRFSLYSGHDITITPLLHALGTHDGKWPPYASRVVFELYTKMVPSGDHYIRVLYNGRDITSQVRFCLGRTEVGMCSLKHFQNFVERDNLEAIGVRGREWLQAFCKMKSLANPD